MSSDGVQVSSAISSDGKEYPDPVPMAVTVDYDPVVDLMTNVRQSSPSQLKVHEIAAPGNGGGFFVRAAFSD